MSNAKSLAEIHFAVLLFGLAGLFGKWLDLPSTIIVLGRVFFAAVSLFFLLFFLKQPLKLTRKRDYLFLPLLGVVLAIHWITFFQSIKISTVAIGLLTFSTFPIFTALLEPVFFREKLQGIDAVLALITFFGVALVIPTFEAGNQLALGALWGVASGATFAILTILNRKFAGTYSGYLIAFYQDAAATLVLLPFLFVLKPTMGGSEICLLLLLGVVFTALSHSLFINGLKDIQAKTASIIGSLEPVYGIIAAALLLNEVLTLRIAAGGFIILGAAFYASIKGGKAGKT